MHCKSPVQARPQTFGGHSNVSIPLLDTKSRSDDRGLHNATAFGKAHIATGQLELTTLCPEYIPNVFVQPTLLNSFGGRLSQNYSAPKYA